MSKELQAFRKICKNLNSYEFSDEYKKNKELIETALNEKVNIENRLDEIFENHNIKSFTELNERLCDYNELKFDDDIKQKKLKAFEIIKEKGVEVGLIRESLYTPSFYNSHFVDTRRHLTQEDFNLLKEELL